MFILISYFSSVQSLSHARLFVTPKTAAHQASLSITNSWSLLKLMSIESVMPSNHLILCHPFLLLSSIFQASGSFPVSQFFASGGQKYWNFSFSISHSKITADGDCSHEIKRHLLLERKAYDQPRQHIKKQRHYFADKGLSSQRYGFCSSHVWMWELDNKEESWALKNWCFWIVVLEKTLESPLDSKESNQLILKEISPEYSSQGLILKLKL